MDRLIKFWGGEYDEYPLVHAEDGFYLEEPYPFDLHLFPKPWLGDLTRGKLFLLHLSPGLSKAEADFEKKRPEFRKALRANLLGRTPHLLLDPAFKAHPGRAAVEATLKGVASRDVLHRHMVQMFLVPYHHKNLGGDAATSALARRFSTRDDMQNFVNGNLAPRARAGEITLIVVDGAAEWGLSAADECETIVVYDAAEAKAGLVTPKTRGGKAARRQLAALAD